MAWDGPVSLRGRDGRPGPEGEPGEDGPFVPGPPGATGATGSTGPTGAAGAPGPPGMAGEDRSEDVVFVPGSQGPAGVPGATGAAGAPGPPGLSEPEWEDAPPRPPMITPTGAHSNFPYTLGDDGRTHVYVGFIGLPVPVATSESTTSNTPVELTTAQRLTFVLDESRAVVITAYCNALAGSLVSPSIFVDVDGSVVTLQQVTCQPGYYGLLLGSTIQTLAAGAHTLKLKFQSQASISVAFANRFLIAELSP